MALLPCLLTSDMFVFLYSLFLCGCIPPQIPLIPSLQALWGRMIPTLFAQPSTVGAKAPSVLCYYTASKPQVWSQNKEDSIGRKWDLSLLPGTCLLPCIRQSKKAKRAGCVQGRSWNSAQVNGRYPDGCGNSHDGSQNKTKWKQNHMPCTLRSPALFLSLPFSWLLPQVFLLVQIIVCYSVMCMSWITITPLLH